MAPSPPQPSSDRLDLLLRLTQSFNSSLDLDEVLNRVMDEVIEAMHAERGFVMLCESVPSEDTLIFRAARGIDQQSIEDPQFQISRSVVDRAAREGQPILTSDAQLDDRFSGRQSIILLGLRSILCVPLKIKDKVSGVIYVDNRIQADIFTQADLDLLNAIASSAAMAVENARLYQVAVEKGRMERELQMAYKVQTSLLPAEIPQVSGWEFGARWQPAREVAGDYYDFIPCDGGKLGLVIADVTDKGMPAALFMAFTRSIVRANVSHPASPAEGISEANRLICVESHEGLFVTLFFALLDTKTGEVTYVNAGHNPPLFFSAVENRLSQLTSTGIPLGIDSDTPFEQRRIQLNRGDFILFYTDGVTEAIDTHEEEFGMPRLQRFALEHKHHSPTDILSALEREIENFTGSTALYDDTTIVVAKCLSVNRP